MTQEAVDAATAIFAADTYLAPLVQYFGAEGDIIPPGASTANEAEVLLDDAREFVAVTFPDGLIEPAGIGAPGEVPYTETGIVLVFACVPALPGHEDVRTRDERARALMRRVLRAFLGQTREGCSFDAADPNPVAEPWRGNWWRIGFQINYWLIFDL